VTRPGDEREAFESVMRLHFKLPSLTFDWAEGVPWATDPANPNGDIIDCDDFWIGWQARATKPEPRVERRVKDDPCTFDENNLPRYYRDDTAHPVQDQRRPASEARCPTCFNVASVKAQFEHEGRLLDCSDPFHAPPVCGTCGGTKLMCVPRENVEHEHDNGCICPSCASPRGAEVAPSAAWEREGLKAAIHTALAAAAFADSYDTSEIAADVALSRPIPAQQPWGTEELARAIGAEFMRTASVPTVLSASVGRLAARVALSRPLAGPVVADYEAGARAYVEASIDQDGPIFYATDEGAINLLTRAIIDAAIGEGKP